MVVWSLQLWFQEWRPGSKEDWCIGLHRTTAAHWYIVEGLCANTKSCLGKYHKNFYHPWSAWLVISLIPQRNNWNRNLVGIATMMYPTCSKCHYSVYRGIWNEWALNPCPLVLCPMFNGLHQSSLTSFYSSKVLMLLYYGVWRCYTLLAPYL